MPAFEPKGAVPKQAMLFSIMAYMNNKLNTPSKNIYNEFWVISSQIVPSLTKFIYKSNDIYHIKRYFIKRCQLGVVNIIIVPSYKFAQTQTNLKSLIFQDKGSIIHYANQHKRRSYTSQLSSWGQIRERHQICVSIYLCFFFLCEWNVHEYLMRGYHIMQLYGSAQEQQRRGTTFDILSRYIFTCGCKVHLTLLIAGGIYHRVTTKHKKESVNLYLYLL